MRVAGIDPSLTCTGLAAIDRGKVSVLSDVRSSGSPRDSLTTRLQRIEAAAHGVATFVMVHDPHLVVIENPSYGSSFGSPHERAGLWWRIVKLVSRHGYPIATVVPQGRAKYGTGKGNASKRDVLAATRVTYAPVLGSVTVRNDNQGDALLLGSMGSRVLGYPVEPDGLSEEHLKPLKGASWPDVPGLVI